MTKADALALKEYKVAVKDIERLTNIRGCQFIGIQGYTNSKGEVSNQCINTGVDHSKVLVLDQRKYMLLFNGGEGAKTLKERQMYVALHAHYSQKYGEKTFMLALGELIKSNQSCVSGTSVRSQAQKDAYIWINRGMKYCIATRRIMVYGYFVSKTVLVKGVYPEVKSQAKTLCKNEIKKALNIKSDLYRQFIIEMDKVDCFMIANNKIEIPMLEAA